MGLFFPSFLGGAPLPQAQNKTFREDRPPSLPLGENNFPEGSKAKDLFHVGTIAFPR